MKLVARRLVEVNYTIYPGHNRQVVRIRVPERSLHLSWQFASCSHASPRPLESHKGQLSAVGNAIDRSFWFLRVRAADGGPIDHALQGDRHSRDARWFRIHEPLAFHVDGFLGYVDLVPSQRGNRPSLRKLVEDFLSVTLGKPPSNDQALSLLLFAAEYLGRT